MPYPMHNRTSTAAERDAAGLSAASGQSSRSPFAHLSLISQAMLVSSFFGSAHVGWQFFALYKSAELADVGYLGIQQTVDAVVGETLKVTEDAGDVASNAVTGVGEVVAWGLFWVKIILSLVAMRASQRILGARSPYRLSLIHISEPTRPY